jgi:integrase
MTRLTVPQLSKDIEEFLTFKRALGYGYRRGEATLRSFECFARSGRNGRARFDLGATTRAWLQRLPGRKPVTLACDLGALRQLCLYRRRHDPSSFVPPLALAPQTDSIYVPYVFSRDEITALVRAASRHSGRNFWPGMLRMLMLTLYCTGLRFGEAVRLQDADLDRLHNVLFIRASKGRSRLVPFQSDLALEFHHYLLERGEVIRAAGRRHDGAVFVGRNGRSISIKAASDVVRHLLRKLGLKGASGRTGPRPYDLRHAFAVHRLTAWYHEKADIHARLPWLSAYMGHVSVLGTEVYLHATPELLQLASDRFADRLADHGVSL